MIRLLSALSAVVLCALVGHAADPLEFKEFASKGGKFKVLMPGKVETSESKKGDITTFAATAKPAAGKVFTVTYFDVKFDIPAAKSQEMLKLFGAGVKGKQVSDKEKTLGKNKLPARETVYEADQGVFIRSLLVLDGQRIYHIIYGAPNKDEVTSKDADKFFESFEVVK